MHMNKESKPNGRPSVFKADYTNQAAKLCLLGATDKDLADFYGVSQRTINTWKEKHPEFLHSLKSGKDAANERVKRSLYQRAIGYENPDVDIRAVNGKIVQTKFVKRYPPDTTACIFWLKNRMPEEWRDVQHQRIGGEGEKPVELQVNDDRPLKDVPYERLCELANLVMETPRPDTDGSSNTH